MLKACTPRTTETVSVEQGIEFDETAAAQEEQMGAPKAGAGKWASCVRIVNAANLQTTRLASHSLPPPPLVLPHPPPLSNLA